MSNPVNNLAQVFAVLKPDLSVEPITVSPGIYDELDKKFDRFRGHVLVAEYEFSEDWSTWERHPAGDEIVVLLSGKAEMVLHKDAGDESLVLVEPGSYVIVPEGTWHTAKTSVTTRMIFITPGEGTENRADV
jgi:mannose-6-phosphate isomerase-like protein (cupin superfamily)